MTNPHLPQAQRSALVDELMIARRNVRSALRENNATRLAAARAAVDAAKHALGERGPPWWTDGAKDLNRYLVKNTPYIEWYEHLDASQG